MLPQPLADELRTSHPGTHHFQKAKKLGFWNRFGWLAEIFRETRFLNLRGILLKNRGWALPILQL